MDANAFLAKWNEYALSLSSVLHAQYSSEVFCTSWPEDIDKLFILVKLLPANTASKRVKDSTRREVFQKATEKLIVFRKVEHH